MLTKIAIENFKSIGSRIELELKPLTILTGPNGSGKSSVLEALCLFVQSIGTGSSGYDFKGNYYPGVIKYSRLEDIAHKGDLKKPIRMEVHIKPSENEALKLMSNPEISHLLASFFSIDKIDSIGCWYSYGKFEEDGTYAEQGIFCNEKKIIEVKRLRRPDSTYIDVFTFPEILKEVEANGPVDYILYPHIFRPRFKDKVPRIGLSLIDFATTVVNMIASRLKPSSDKSKVYFLSAQRGVIEPEVSTSGFYNWVGKKGEYLISILTQVSSPAYENKKEKIKKWIFEFGLKDPWGGWSGPNIAKGQFIDKELDVPLNLALASYGSSQILTVVTQLFWSEEGDIILIEEPEISIHPQGQAKLPELFVEAIKEGKQIIITTHSNYLPLALSRALKKGLKPEDIAVYEVTKDKDGTKVERRVVNEKGYIKGWIKSFYGVEEKLVEEWARAISESYREEE